MSTPKFTSSTVSIYTELKRTVNNYFKTNGIPPTGNSKLYLKALLLVLCHAGVYVHLVLFTPVAWLAILECILLGLLTAGIGFNVMHDGAHGSFSSRSWVNRAAALTIDYLGASSFMWHSKHNIIHHTYTNIEGVDDDIEARPFLRLAPTQKYHKMHKYQHLYFWVFYGLLYLAWVFYTDYKKYFSGKVGNVPIRKMELKDHILFWSFKLAHLLLYVLIPIYTVGFNWWLAGFLVYTVSAGMVLSLVFQLAHTVEETAFPLAIQPENKMMDEWAIHQLRTTANFATGNKLITWYVGGLNYQVEHHLFPRVSHIHYPAISKIIKNVCANMGAPYLEYEKVIAAITSHVIHLKNLGQINNLPGKASHEQG